MIVAERSHLFSNPSWEKPCTRHGSNPARTNILQMADPVRAEIFAPPGCLGPLNVQTLTRLAYRSGRAGASPSQLAWCSLIASPS